MKKARRGAGGKNDAFLAWGDHTERFCTGSCYSCGGDVPAAAGDLLDRAIDQHKRSGGITYMDADRAAALVRCASLPQLPSVHAHNLFESRKSSRNNDSVQSSR